MYMYTKQINGFKLYTKQGYVTWNLSWTRMQCVVTLDMKVFMTTSLYAEDDGILNQIQVISKSRNTFLSVSYSNYIKSCSKFNEVEVHTHVQVVRDKHIMVLLQPIMLCSNSQFYFNYAST